MSDETEREGRCTDCLYGDSGWCKDSCACDCHPANAETGLERAEQNFRALVRCRSNGGGLEDFLAEYDRRGEERDEALGLLRELAKYWVRLESDGKDWSEVNENLGPTARDLKRRIRALVERVGPAGAHPAESED